MATEQQEQVRLGPINNPAEHQALAVRQESAFSLIPRNLSEAMDFAKMISETDMIPKDFKGKPGNVLIAVQMGSEVGLKPMAAIQNIAVINGRPGLFGDATVAVVRSHPEFEYLKEWWDAKTETAFCSIKRKGQDEETRFFSFEDARRAKLWGKDGPWSTYPRRQASWRAKSWALRDVFADALKGIGIREELIDIPPSEELLSSRRQDDGESERATSTKQAIAAAADASRKPAEGTQSADAQTEQKKDGDKKVRPLAEVLVDIEAADDKDKMQALFEEISAMPMGEGRTQAGTRWSARLKLLKQLAKPDGNATIDHQTGEVDDEFTRQYNAADKPAAKAGAEDVPQ